METAQRRYLFLVPALVALCPAPYGAATARDGASQEGSPGPTLADKTLVAWVYLADTTQRAGSEFFRRTPADQSAYPPETAGGKTLLQFAIVYDEHLITKSSRD